MITLPTRTQLLGYLCVLAIQALPCNGMTTSPSKEDVTDFVSKQTKDFINQKNLIEALFFAVKWGSHTDVCKVLAHKPDLEVKDILGQTALFYAVYRTDDPGIIHNLILSGANKQTVNNQGLYPIHLAIENNAIKTLPFLITIKDLYAKMETV